MNQLSASTELAPGDFFGEKGVSANLGSIKVMQGTGEQGGTGQGVQGGGTWCRAGSPFQSLVYENRVPCGDPIETLWRMSDPVETLWRM